MQIRVRFNGRCTCIANALIKDFHGRKINVDPSSGNITGEANDPLDE